MNVKVKYNKQVFEFNLNEELKINENNLNTNIKGHTRSYAFLCMLHVKLIMKHRDQSKLVKRMKDDLMVTYKPKYKTVTEAEAVMYKKNPKLREMEDEMIHIEELKEVIQVSVRAFEARKDLLQSISANVRREK
jgi:hypothetical protein